jgi:uroporphyrinogen-III synthase
VPGLTLVITRPGEAGRALADELQRGGQPALWLPAFEFGPAPDAAAASAVLAQLASFDLAIFVSPQAVRATAGLLAGRWPAGTAIAAVGAGTRAALEVALPGASAARLLVPPADEQSGGSGSESLWPVLQAMQPPPRRVLLLRAQGGREWLAERLQAAGAVVAPLAVYSRLPFEPPAELRSRLAAAAASGIASLISSSDAVDALLSMLAGAPEVLRAMRAGPALATHPRIAARLRAAGFANVACCAPDAASIRAALGEAGR